MFYKVFYPYFKSNIRRGFVGFFNNESKSLYRLCSQTTGEREVFELFFDNKVQELLRNLTRPDLEKVFRKRKNEMPFESPVYEFMTTKELEKAREEAELSARKMLTMPPALPPREEENYIFEKNDKLEGYSHSKFVFTDISFGKTDRNRTIVVREPDGTLRKAKLEERSRMNELYFPRHGRKYSPPEMFQDPYLQSLLERCEYEFVLDRACIQFEPDDANFIRTAERTYSAIDSVGHYEYLRSTRHFGPMVFYLVRTRDIDNLLLENLKTGRVEDAVWLISLYHIIHPNAKSKSVTQGKDFEFIKAFIELDSNKKAILEEAYNTFRDYLSSPKAEQLKVEQ